nr:polymorphic toxin-type HINT domain-containing protein [Brevibacillus brevis]
MTKAGNELPGAVEKAGKELPGAVKKAGVEYVGVDNVNTLTDGNWSSDDAVAAGSVAISIVPGGKLLKTAKAETKAAVKVLKGCNCFTAGTKVLTDEGEKNIEDIEVGDKVLSKDETTGEVAYKDVTATFNHGTDEIYQIHVGGQTIESTFNHPFYVKDKGWTFVKDLKVGDLLVQSDGNTLKIESIELLHKKVTVYNMTVDEFHTYFVSDLGIWVHNTNCSGNWSNPKWKWGNSKSGPTYGHTFDEHGQKVTDRQLADRARGMGHQIGKFLDNQSTADFLADVAKEGSGVYDLALPSHIKGRAFLPDGTELTPDRFKVVIKEDGSIKTAYPYNSGYPTSKPKR